MVQVWECTVRIEFPVEPGDIEHRQPGDAEADFAGRAFDARLREELNWLRENLGRHARWSIVTTPAGHAARRCEA